MICTDPSRLRGRFFGARTPSVRQIQCTNKAIKIPSRSSSQITLQRADGGSASRIGVQTSQLRPRAKLRRMSSTIAFSDSPKCSVALALRHLCRLASLASHADSPADASKKNISSARDGLHLRRYGESLTPAELAYLGPMFVHCPNSAMGRLAVCASGSPVRRPHKGRSEHRAQPAASVRRIGCACRR